MVTIMETAQNYISDILSAEQTKYIIPIYQRPYSWTEKQLSRLWDDIIKIHNFKKKDYFIGAMVSVEEKMSASLIKDLVIIDGQQRLTTFIILFAALRDYYLDNKQNYEAQIIQDTYLTISTRQNTYNRIESRKNDQEALVSLIENKPHDKKASLIMSAYDFFMKKIKNSKIKCNELVEAINQICLVQIILNKENEDSQSIFESLNSTGKNLTGSDLIRNYLLMNLKYKEQEHIYSDYWINLEELFTINNTFNNEIADNFIRDYLTMKTRVIPNKDQLYEQFQAYFNNLTIENKNLEVCKDLYLKAIIYEQIINGYYRNDKEVSSILGNIKGLQINITYPFFMQLIDLFEAGKITQEDLCLGLQLSISFIIRRNVCGLPSNRLNKIFASLISHLDLNNFSKSINEYFFSLRDKDRFPRDDEFMQDFKTFNVYKKLNKKYILKSLEEYDNKNHINIDTATIEHILPQGSLGAEWQKMLGENYRSIQEQYRDRIGNLTLTNYNSELSNKPFLTKLIMKGGIQKTPYKLNQYFIENDIQVWNPDQIDKRGSILAQEAVKIWIFPTVEKDFVPKQKAQYTINDFNTSEESLHIFHMIDDYAMSLSEDVNRYITKTYIVYEIKDKSFLSLAPRVSKIVVGLHLNINEINDSKQICRDVTNIGHLHLGKSEFSFTNNTNPTYAFDLITQSFNKNK
ncbi:GmrSD restriction endonuclease domain-containing protein [Mycoplasma sp. VS292A]|uniref:GmrSD restriction endonuclease domain-containing protein n=1 Tax=unclassified Mycoplasma TaxID=2683645 RepID=UPI003AAE4314